MQNLKAGIQSAQSLSLDLQSSGKRPELLERQLRLSGKRTVGTGDKTDRNPGGLRTVIVPPDQQNSIRRSRSIQPRPNGKTHPVAGRIQRIDAVRDHAVFLRLGTLAIHIFQPEIIQIQRIERIFFRLSGGKHPDIVCVGIRLDLETPGKPLPFRGRTELEPFQHRIVGIAVGIGKQTEINDERRRLVHHAVFIRTDFRVKRDFNFPVTGKEKVGKLHLIPRHAFVTGNHQALSGISARGSPEHEHLCRIRTDCVNRSVIDFQNVPRHSAPDLTELHTGVPVDDLPGKTGDGNSQQ